VIVFAFSGRSALRCRRVARRLRVQPSGAATPRAPWLLAAAACLLGAVEPSHAAPWLAPGDARLRHDLHVLADRGVLRAPITTWPVSWPDVHRDVASASPETLADPVIAQSLQRVRRAAALASQSGWSAANASVSIAERPDPLRAFDDTPREDAQIGLASGWLGERFALQLRLSAVDTTTDDPNGDDQALRFDGSYVGATVGNLTLTAGFMDRWWGPGWDGSLILGSNARPVPSIAIERKYSERSRLPVLRWFGPWRASIALGQMEGSGVALPDVRFFAARLTAKPSHWLELGLSRTAQWCGEGRPCDASTFRDLLLGRDNREPTSSPSTEPGNQMAGYDLRVSSPWRALPVALYGQFIGEDEAGGLPAKFLGQLGAEYWGGHERYGAWRVRYEYADTSCSFSRERPQFNCAYRNGQYPQGYSHRGRIIGHALDNDGRMWSASAMLVRPSGTAFMLIARRVELNRDGAADPTHRTSPAGRSALRSLDLQVDAQWFQTAVSVGLGYHDPTEPKSADGDVRGYLRLARGF
jgi:hypothetical protein